MMIRPAARFWVLLLLFGAVATGADFDMRSLTLRTALHHDASLEGPFEELRALYREVGREGELVQLYQNHLAQYPADAGARAVLLRLLLAGDAPEAAAVAAEARRLHPENGYLHYLAFRVTGELEALSRAITLEPRMDRRGSWLRELLDAAIGEAERDLAEARLSEERDQRLANAGEGLPELLGWMNAGGFLELARETLKLADRAAVAPEIELDLALRAAGFEENQAAIERLSALLARLTADHPRRAELVRARRGLSDAEVRPDPTSAAGSVDLAMILEDEGKSVEAGQVLAEAALRMPHLAWIEERARPLLEPEVARWRDYVTQRVLLKPARPDLATEAVVLTFAADGAEAGKVAVAAEVERGSPESLVALGNALLERGFAEGAVAALRGAERRGAQDFATSERLVRALAAQGDAEGLADAVKELRLQGVPGESWARLASFLEGESFGSEARELLERGLEAQPGNFEASLALAKVAGPDRGAALLEQCRGLAADEDAYREWLIAAAEFSARQGKAESLWSREEARLGAFADGFDAVAVRRVRTFAEVALERSQEARGRRVAAKLLEGAEAEIEKRPDIQRLAVAVFAGDPSKSPDVERYLMRLLELEPESNPELRLRLALLYQLVGRLDLLGAQLSQIDWMKIDGIALLDDAAVALPEVRTRILQRLTELRPADVRGWEEALNALWRDGRDAEFRASAAKAGELALPAAVRTELEDRVLASWQREIEAEVQRGELEIALRKVRAVAREGENEWARWTGAVLLERTGRSGEADAWWSQLSSEGAKAMRAWRSDPIPPEPAEAERIGPLSRVGWRFETLPGAHIANLAATGSTVAVLDDRNRVHGLDAATGKVRWKVELRGKIAGVQGDTFVAPDVLAGDGKVFVPAGDRIVALDASTGETLWEGQGGSGMRLGLAARNLVVALLPNPARLVALDRGTGKLQWTRELDSEIAGLSPMSTGFAALGRSVAVLTDRLSVFRAASGERLWTRRLGSFGPIDLDAGTATRPESSARHVAFDGDRVWAMEAGGVSSFAVDFAAGSGTEVAGIYVGGACFQTASGVEILDSPAGLRRKLNGSGDAILVTKHLILRNDSGRLTAWQAKSGRRLWETALHSHLAAVPGASRWWRGTVTEERWQGFVIRRSRPVGAVALSGAVVVSGETSVEAWVP